VRVLPHQAARIDAWRDAQPDKPGRPEAIRRLVDAGLSTAGGSEAPNKAATRKSAELAADTINKSAPRAERPRAKRRLIGGPEEFRGERADQPKKR
jgi:hypothetical protein